MFVARLIFVFVLVIGTPLWADQFRMSLKIANVFDLPDARARVFIYTANGSNQPGLTTRELGPGDKNSYDQFEVRIDDLAFSDESERGFFYADIVGRNGEVLRRVPLTYFDRDDISSLNWLSRSVQAVGSKDDQFQDSYPAYVNETGLFTDDNSDFLLLAFRTLVSKGFVTNDKHWDRLFQIFLGNVRYFGDGGVDNISRILTFLEDRYDQDKQNSAYNYFYLELLSRILTLDLGGRSVQGYENLEDYIVARISIVFSEQPAVSMLGSARALQELNNDNKVSACFRVSLAFMKSLALNSEIYPLIEDGSSLELNFKRVLKRSIDCTQKQYVNDPEAGPNASRGNLAGGVEYLIEHSEESREMLINFYETYNKAESLFPRREDKSDWRQVYEYYDIIRESGLIRGDGS